MNQAFAQTADQAAQTAVNVVDHCTTYEGNFIFHAFCQGGGTMYLILIVALLTAFLIVDRLFRLHSLTIDKVTLNETLYSLLLRGELKQAIAFCDRKPTPLTNTLKAGLVQVLNKRTDEEVQVAMDAAVLRETPKLEGWTAFLAVFGNVGVLIGLLGTVAGLITSFGGVAKADQSLRAQMLSKGISEALNCTAFGLLVAIVAIVAYGFFQMRIGKAVNDMVESSMTLMNLVVANRDKMKD